MKAVYFIALLLLASCSNPTANNNSTITKEEKEIAKGLIQGAFDDLWAGVDSTKISTYHTDDFIILEHGEVWDNNRIKQFMRKKLAEENRSKRINIMDYISIDKYGQRMEIENDALYQKA